MKKPCKAGKYTTNAIILRNPIICWGFGGQSPCKYLRDCIEDNKESFSKKKYNSIIKKLSNN